MWAMVILIMLILVMDVCTYAVSGRIGRIEENQWRGEDEKQPRTELMVHIVDHL